MTFLISFDANVTQMYEKIWVKERSSINFCREAADKVKEELFVFICVIRKAGIHL